MVLLNAVHVDTVNEKSLVAIQPNPAFQPMYEIATICEAKLNSQSRYFLTKILDLAWLWSELCKVCHDFPGEEVEAFTRDGIWEKDEEIVDPIFYIFW